MVHFLRITAILCLFSGKVYSQDCDIRNLAFEGAGIRGIAYAGVIDVLEKNDRLGQVQKVGGTSAGAITALMVSLGYTSTEIADLISSTQFRKFNDGRFMFPGGIARMKNLYGWYRGDRFTEWTAKIIEAKTANPDITFEELSSLGYKDLYITATSLNQQKLIVFSKENYPNMKVKDAVRISVSIPLYFKAVFIDSQGAVHKKPNAGQNLDVVVDGGIIGNFPITIFDSITTDSANNQHRVPNFQTIGVRIDSDQQIQHDADSRELAPIQIRNLNDYMSALYILVIENLNRHELTDDDWARTISVSSVGISPRIKRMSREEKERLIQSGRDYTMKYMSANCGTLVKP
ncbi:patatin-like phospholipase family protein [Pontibacter sp. JH31]|uniref:Patatin-like phospholipase family protein n=1 Tax=Pontibacter aquaedesilientis TaxID=2766980 RepID=A0ABR7XKU3_9BACT|nr:patatin-like phospholipase family protein [Pontibacter aquaedesilientis]MBD1398912.1 patatin-like phospholipase family protein [Pontibacter aquaedesilientis]